MTIPLTDDRGRFLLPSSESAEPEPGSVVLTEGLHGTGWQRHFNDGLWHSTRGGRAKTWEQMLTMRNLVLVYDAEERVPANEQYQWTLCKDETCTFFGKRKRNHQHVRKVGVFR